MSSPSAEPSAGTALGRGGRALTRFAPITLLAVAAAVVAGLALGPGRQLGLQALFQGQVWVALPAFGGLWAIEVIASLVLGILAATALGQARGDATLGGSLAQNAARGASWIFWSALLGAVASGLRWLLGLTALGLFVATGLEKLGPVGGVAATSLAIVALLVISAFLAVWAELGLVIAVHEGCGILEGLWLAASWLGRRLGAIFLVAIVTAAAAWALAAASSNLAPWSPAFLSQPLVPIGTGTVAVTVAAVGVTLARLWRLFSLAELVRASPRAP